MNATTTTRPTAEELLDLVREFDRVMREAVGTDPFVPDALLATWTVARDLVERAG